MKSIRKLAVFSIGYSLAVLLSHYLMPYEALVYASCTALLLSAAGFLLKGNARKRAVLLLAAASIGFFGYKLHCDNTVNACEPYYGKTLTVQAQAVDYPQKRTNSYSVLLKLTDETMPDVKLMLYSYGDELCDIKAGDSIKAELKLRSAAVKYGEESDSLISDGIYLVGSLGNSIEITARERVPLKLMPLELGRILREQIKSLFPEDARAFMLALMTGDRSEYYSDDSLYCAMSLSGLSHVVAVSGMHVSFLVAFLQLVLGKSRRTSLISLIFVWAFVVMSGSTASAIRAGFMLSVFLLAPVLNRQSDRATALFFTLAIILAQNPFAVASVSLQLSFAAISGIYLLAQPIYDFFDELLPKVRKTNRLKLYIIGALSSSLAVTVFSVPLIALYFGYITVLMPITNILCLWAVSALFAGGYAVCAIGAVSGAVGVFAAKILAWLVRYIAFVVKFTAGISFAAVFTNNAYAAAWSVFVYAVFALCWFLRDKSARFKPLLPTVLSIIALVSVFTWTRFSAQNECPSASVYDVGSGQCISLTEGGHAVIVDCGFANSDNNAGQTAANDLRCRGYTKIDCLVLTHIHADHANGVVRLINLMELDKIIIPDNTENADSELLSDILTAAEKKGIEVVKLSCDTDLSFGDIKLKLYAPFEQGDKNEAGLMLSAEAGNKTLLVTGDVSEATERKLVNAQELEDTDILIIGHHGSKYSTSQELLAEAKPETAIISVGYNNYGHPSQLVLEKLCYYNIPTYTTQMSGTIKITVGD